MTGIRIGFAFLVVIALTFSPQRSSADQQDVEFDISYAEHLPLVPESLMLEAIRAEDKIVAAGERGHIIVSSDQGLSWSQADVVPTRSTLTSLFAIGDRIWAAGHDSVILTSADGGKNWTRQYFDPNREQPIMDLYFSDKSNGIAIGAYGLMLITEDGGHNWEDWAVNDEDDAHLNALLPLADGTLLIAGEAGYSYRSIDGGETWESIEVPYQGSMFGAITDAQNCVLFYGLRGHVMRSCDNGDSWEEPATNSEATLLASAAQDGLVLLAGNSGTILIYQGGKFSTYVHSSGVDFSSALAMGSGLFMLTGEEGTYFYPESNSERAGQ